MRSIIKMVGLAFFATLAFSAISATSAFAVEETLPAFLANPNGAHHFPIFFTSRGLGHALLNTANHKIECSSVLDLGFILPQPTTLHSMLGDIHFIFHGCKEGSISCNSSGQPAGLIETRLYLFHIGRLLTLPGNKRHVLIVILVSNTTFECSIFAKIEVEGSLVGLIPETNAGGGNQFNKQNTELLVEFSQSAAGKQSLTTFENTLPIETLNNLHLSSKLNGGAAEEASEVATADETVEPAGETVELKL